MPALPAPNLTRCPRTLCGQLLTPDEDGWSVCISGHGPFAPYGFVPFDIPPGGQQFIGHNPKLKAHYAAKRKAAEGRHGF